MEIYYKITDSKLAIQFLKNNKATSHQISLSPLAQEYLGAYVDNKLIGLIGCSIGKRITRIKQFLVTEKYRNLGIGLQLLKLIMSNHNECRIFTTYATPKSFSLFSKCQFVPYKILKNNITFMKKVGI